MGTIRYISGDAAFRSFASDILGKVNGLLETSGHIATGSLQRSNTAEVQEFPGGSAMRLEALPHWRWAGNGRPPGKMPPVDPLIAWAKTKGLATDDRAARSIGWAVALTIKREGSESFRVGGKNVYASAIDLMQPRIVEVQRAYLQDTDNAVAEEFNRSKRA